VEERTIVDPGFAPAPAGDATRVMQSPFPAAGGGFSDATQHALTVACPVCQTPNGPAERYCQDCGLLMGSQPADVEPLPDAAQLPRLVDAASGREYLLNPGLNTVGRESADIVLADPSVSRRHAQVTLDGGSLTVEDLGSTNGTFVAGSPVRAGTPVAAQSGTLLRFGSVQLSLAIPGAAGAPEAIDPVALSPAAAPAAASAAPISERGAPVGRLTLADGTEFPLYSGVNTIGRRSANEIVLADSFMSGKHAEITCGEDGQVQFVDVGSTNGSFHAGARLAPNSPIPLADGATVRMGKTEVTFRSSAPAASVERTVMAPMGEATLMGGPPEDDPWPTTPFDASGGVASGGPEAGGS